MAKGEHAGSGGVFWITFVVLGLAILIGLFVWMVKSRKEVPHTPERSRKVWSEPVAEIDDQYRAGGRETADPSPDIRPLPLYLGKLAFMRVRERVISQNPTNKELKF